MIMYDLYGPEGKLINQNGPLEWIDAEALADVWLFDEGIELEIVEVDVDDETPAEFNEWLRAGGY